MGHFFPQSGSYIWKKQSELPLTSTCSDCVNTFSRISLSACNALTSKALIRQFIMDGLELGSEKKRSPGMELCLLLSFPSLSLSRLPLNPSILFPSSPSFTSCNNHRNVNNNSRLKTYLFFPIISFLTVFGF